MAFNLTKPAALLRIAGNDSKLFIELAQIMAHAFPDYIDSLEQALARNDTVATRAVLHKIKGSLQMLGAESTLEQVSTLGAYIRTSEALPDAQDTRHLIDQLHAILIEVERYQQNDAPAITPQKS